ncbi:hypothetical protein GR140_30840 (plasmid) [Pseudomonas putida]|uniref:hypothetical protein n=1 Tax=Pseudomonas putida TaxID=303 RepID=UPI001BAFD710|nr:hypothetical protein [Pseudomonas putida]QUG93159.1 hypothetical protein GR140_30840 [Pseudomonas putida]
MDLDLDSAEGVLGFWQHHLAYPEQHLEELVCSSARLIGYRAYPEATIPEQIMTVPQLKRAWISGWNQALRNNRFDFDKWVNHGCP